MLRVGNNQVAGPSSQRVCQVVQPAGAHTKAIGAVLAVRTVPSLKVSAALDKFWLRQILNAGDSFGHITNVFAWSKHCDILQHRFLFPC